jgi:hypothetical protein
MKELDKTPSFINKASLDAVVDGALDKTSSFICKASFDSCVDEKLYKLFLGNPLAPVMDEKSVSFIEENYEKNSPCLFVYPILNWCTETDEWRVDRKYFSIGFQFPN